MILSSVLPAIGLFVVTNIDDIIVLSLFFARGAGQRGTTARITAGQYLGFTGILGAAVLATLGAGAFLPRQVIPYFGLIPLALGLWAAWQAWRGNDDDDDDDDDGKVAGKNVGILTVAAVTFANGGDNIGVYVPIFAVSTIATIGVYIIVFLIGVAIWCAAGRYFASHPIIAKALSRWGHIVLPVALITIGALILIKGGAFAL